MENKTRKVSVAYSDDCNVRVSNCIKIIDKELFIFILQDDCKSH